VVKPGNWYVELDDGSGVDLHTEFDGGAHLDVGDATPGRPLGYVWRIDRVEPDRKYAHAVPAE
jgi:hypothetical protein